MQARADGTAAIALELLEFINGCATDEEAVGAIKLLIDFLEEVYKQRSRLYWEVKDWDESLSE